MNAHTKPENLKTAIENAAPEKPAVFDIDKAHILRSKFINNFSKVEILIAEYAMRLDSVNYNLSASDYINKIKQDTSKKPEEIDALCDEFKAYIKFRGELAHAVISVQIMWDKPTIVYWNANSKSHSKIKTSACILLSDLKAVTSRLQSIATKFRNLTK